MNTMQRQAVLIVCAIVLPGTAVHAATQYTNETVDGRTSDTGCYTNIAVSSSGTPHIVYVDLVTSPLRYATRVGDRWRTAVIDPTTGISCNALALDQMGNLHFAYFVRNAGVLTNDFRYAFKDKERVSIMRIDTAPDSQNNEITMAVDSRAIPHIVYQKARGVRYATITSGWQIETVIGDDADATVSYGEALSISIGPDESPRILFTRSTSTRTSLYYSERRHGRWITEFVDSGSVQTGNRNSLAVDAQGRPHCAYAVGGVGTRYATKSAGAWSFETVSSGGGSYQYIGLDQRGTPHVAYLATDDLRYATRTGSGWTTELVDALGSVGLEIGLAIDRNGLPHISHFDASGFDLKYATSAVRLDRPLGGEFWPPGSQQTVSWTGVGPVAVELSTDGGANYVPLVSGVMQNSVVVTVPSTESDAVRVRVVRDSLMSLSESGGLLTVAKGIRDPWWSDTVRTVSDVGRSVSLALDSHGLGRTAYWDFTSNALRYSQQTGRRWTQETVDGSNAGQYCSLALNAQSEPCIAYYQTVLARLKFAKRTGGTWVTEYVDSTFGPGGKHASLALDRTGAPHIAFYAPIDQVNSRLRYATRPIGATSWTVEAVPPTYADTAGSYCSLAVDRRNRVHISYYDIAKQDLKYACKDNGAWRIDRVDSTGIVGRFTAVALDAGDVPHISYYDDTRHRLMYASKRSDGVWQLECADDVGDVGQYSALRLREDGQPIITYYDATNRVLKVAWRTGDEWATRTVDPYATGTTYGNALCLDHFGTAVVAYYDSTLGNCRLASDGVRLLAPEQAVTWQAGSRKVISWAGAGPASVWLSTDGGATFDQLASAENGEYRLTVPNRNSNYCKIKVERALPYAVAISDSLFTIQGAVSLLFFEAEVGTADDPGVELRWGTDPGPPEIVGYRVERNVGSGWVSLGGVMVSTILHDADARPGAVYRLFATDGFAREVMLGSVALSVSALSAWPVPLHVSEALTISFYAPMPGPTRIGIFDITGRRVHTISDLARGTGLRSIRWSGRSESGRGLEPGMYFVRILGDPLQSTVKLAVVR